jgi:hypothetical protein
LLPKTRQTRRSIVRRLPIPRANGSRFDVASSANRPGVLKNPAHPIMVTHAEYPGETTTNPKR